MLDSVVLAATEDAGLPSFLVPAIAVAITATVFSLVMSRRNRRREAEISGGAPDALAFTIAPAPPLQESLAALRVAGETTPLPQLTRYSRPVVTVSDDGLSLHLKKVGVFMTIPTSDVVTIESRVATIRPQGALMAMKFPAIWVEVTGDADNTWVALPPIQNAYDKLSAKQVDALAAEVRGRLGLLDAV